MSDIKEFKGNERNQYHGMSEYYDEAMMAGYYDYKSTAESLADLIKDGAKVLEIGVGTGLFLDHLCKLRPNCTYYGVDHTDAMINKALENVNTNKYQIHLLKRDVIKMEFERKFDVIFSHGGVWVFLEEVLLSHIFDDDKNRQGLKNIRHHLKNDGKFVINIQPNHSNSDTPMDNGVVFKQRVQEEENFSYKDYWFEKDGKKLSEQRCTYRLWRNEQIDKVLRECGFKKTEVTSDGKFRILTPL
ncbi:hypothetical protein GCAAIG_01150 [Candidatus Electronema halotolerans]